MCFVCLVGWLVVFLCFIFRLLVVFLGGAFIHACRNDFGSETGHWRIMNTSGLLKKIKIFK